jgi:hypothetical protein
MDEHSPKWNRLHGALFAIITPLALLATGCVGSVEVSALGENHEAAPSAQQDVSESQEGKTLLPEIGPLDHFLIRVSDARIFPLGTELEEVLGVDELTAIRNRQRIQQQEFLSVCMQEKGFTYLPRDWITNVIVRRPEGTFIDRNSREWAERFGFGHSTTDIEGRWDSAFESQLVIDEAGAAAEDEAMARMSEPEREAYELALHGDRSAFAQAEWPTTTEEARAMGCRVLQTFEQEQARVPDQFVYISQLATQGFAEILRSDAQMQQIDRDWATCMAPKGFHDWSNPLDPDRYFLDQWISGITGIEFPDYLNWDWDNYPEGPPIVEPTDLIQREIAAAVASWDCRLTTNYDARRNQVNLDLQQQFVDEHWLILEEWAQAVAP